MKISLNWLQDFVEFTVDDPQEIAARITACTAEVEEVEKQGAILAHCCVGQVLSVSKHPDADKLSLCDVQTDKGKKKVVCGGTNLRVGMRVAFAHVGAHVKWHGAEMMTLEKTKIRGEVSEGMICAAEELDLSDRYPDASGKSIIDMGDGDEGVGVSLKEYLGMDDVVLHVDNHAITHRADLFAHVGFARECVAIGIAKWKKKPVYKVPKFGKDPIPFRCKVDTKDHISKYASCAITIESAGQTPDWMKARLESVGFRSINLPIDITNYVAAEVGMPLHSFDIDDLKGDVHFRTAKKGEKIVTLDGVERELPEGAIVLSDDTGIFDLMGVMGGLRSSTKDSTKRIYLHSAVVDPVAIRNTIIATGHRTDASTVYEKGIPKVSALNGLYRAVALFLELVPGAKVVSLPDEWGADDKGAPITLSVDRVNSLLGTELTSKNMASILSDLEFDVVEKKGVLSVTPPLFRLGDISGPHDLMEEIGRVYGYDSIEDTLPTANITPPKRDHRLKTFRCALKEDGYFELLPLSLTSPKLLQKCGMDSSKAAQVENPIGEEVSLLSPSALPALLEHAQREIMNVEDALSTFHIGHVFAASADLHNELGMMVATKKEPDLSNDPFLVVKAHLCHALQRTGYDLTVKPCASPSSFMHPARCASIMINGTDVGSLFEIHPMVRNHFDLPSRAAVCLVNMDALFAIDAKTVVAESFRQFPAITYDVTITLDHSKMAQDIVQTIAQSSELLESVDIADIYAGKPLKDGQYNLTLRCVYRASDRTLKEEEVKQEHEKILKLTNA